VADAGPRQRVAA